MKKAIVISLVALLLNSARSFVFTQTLRPASDKDFTAAFDAQIRKTLATFPDLPAIAIVVIKDDRPTFASASASDVMALSGRGTEEWPPRLVARSVTFWKTFSVACTELKNGLPSRSVPPPPSFRTTPASTSSRWFLSSQSTGA